MHQAESLNAAQASTGEVCCVHSFYHQPAARRVLFWIVFLASWLGCAALLFVDRSGAMEWWLD